MTDSRTPQHLRTRGDASGPQSSGDGLPATGEPPPYDPMAPISLEKDSFFAGQSQDDQLTGVFPAVSAELDVPSWVSSPAPPTRPAQSAAQLLICPECGTSAMVTVNRRESVDFCRTCDYPLFWVPSRVELDRSAETSAESLRRLPGTVGRATVASLACPHCAEPNAVTAQTCIRCGLSMHIIEPPPPPPPVYLPPPPEPVIEIVEKQTPWWVWALVFAGLTILAAIVTIVVLKNFT